MKSRPIGYLIKLLDGLIETDLNGTVVHYGIDRRQWQVLNLLKAGPMTVSDIAVQLGPFLAAEVDASDVVDTLVRAGWARGTTQAFELTQAGSDLLHRAGTDVSVARSRVSEGISRDDYQTTVDTLEAMCRNLGWRDS